MQYFYSHKSIQHIRQSLLTSISIEFPQIWHLFPLNTASNSLLCSPVNQVFVLLFLREVVPDGIILSPKIQPIPHISYFSNHCLHNGFLFWVMLPIKNQTRVVILYAILLDLKPKAFGKQLYLFSFIKRKYPAKFWLHSGIWGIKHHLPAESHIILV